MSIATRAGSVSVVPFTEAEVPAALAFNARMLAGKAPTDFVLPDRPNAPDGDARSGSIVWTKYVAIDDGGHARGGFLLMQQPAVLNGQAVAVANYQAPVSEGILDSRHGMVGMHMLRYVLRQWPHSFVVGMGAADRPLPRLLAAAGWTVRPIPFLFKMVRPRRVFRELRLLQRRPWMRIGARVAADSGAAWAAATAMQARGMFAGGRSLRVEPVAAWGDWAEALWDRVRGEYSFAVARDRATLTALYPLEDARYAARLFRDGESIVGWAVCIRTAMRDHQYFGNLTVTTVLDAVSLPGAAAACAAALTRTVSTNTDLLITNQSHAAWIAAFREAGYASASSNYLLAMSKSLVQAIGDRVDRIHVTRGDGDGRIHLL